jgi:hypothetical protein
LVTPLNISPLIPNITSICPVVFYPRLLPDAAGEAAAVRPFVASSSVGAERLRLVSAAQCLVATGRGTGDVGQPTCRGYTRPDHVVLSPGMFEAVLKFEIAVGVDCGEPGDQESDHLFIVMHLPRVLAQANIFHQCSAACPHTVSEAKILQTL